MEVWQEIKQNKERGAERLVSEFGNRLFAAASLLCANDQDAEDLTFRTLDQAIKKISLYDTERSFFTWLYAIMLNFRRMDLRKKRSVVIPMGASSELPECACEDSQVAALEGSADDSLERAVRSLSAPLREVIVFRYYCDKSIDEIAEELNLPLGTVKSRLHNARAALNEFLSKERSLS